MDRYKKENVKLHLILLISSIAIHFWLTDWLIDCMPVCLGYMHMYKYINTFEA